MASWQPPLTLLPTRRHLSLSPTNPLLVSLKGIQSRLAFVANLWIQWSCQPGQLALSGASVASEAQAWWLRYGTCGGW